MKKIEAVGIWFCSAETDNYLYLIRNDPKYPNHWGLPGGKIEKGECIHDAIKRECTEELGSMPEYMKLIPLERYTVPMNKFEYHTFFCLVEKEFIPVLNKEHLGYAWIKGGTIPKPVHPGFKVTLKMDHIYERMNTLKTIFS